MSAHLSAAPRMASQRRRKSGGGTATVSVHVQDLSQLFNSLDPSPFWDRDLDRDAAAYIEEEFADKRSADVWHLNVHTHQGASLAKDLQAAVENYYARLANAARRDLVEHMRLGRLALLGGVTLFLLSMGARDLLLGVAGELPRLLDEGLILLAWLALWRPAEVLAYEWVPLKRKRRLYERLASIKVMVRAEPHEAKPVTGNP